MSPRTMASCSARVGTLLRCPLSGVGYVHWVAVDPEARGRGLFDAVMGAVEDRFRADGRPVAMLETDDVRLPAIAAYLRRGYVPQYTES